MVFRFQLSKKKEMNVEAAKEFWRWFSENEKSIVERCKTDGRRLVFDIKVCDEVSLIGEGTHERFIVFGDKFLAKTNAKLQK